MSIKPTLLIVPANDPEAAMIIEIARALNLDLWISKQPHGATLDKEKGLVEAVKEMSDKRIVIVEMPGPKIEDKLMKMGFEVVIIDHHDYTGVKRARDPKTNKYLPSSLEQFLKFFKVSNKHLKKLGFDPKLVQGIGIWDRGFYWAVQDEGYSKREIQEVMEYRDKLMLPYHDQKNEEKKNMIAKKAWDKRKEWEQFLIVEDTTNTSIRGRVSLLVAADIGKPTSMIIVEHGRGFIYVQESDFAEELFDEFGGFTFGMGRNWGQKNEKRGKQINLKDIQLFLKDRL